MLLQNLIPLQHLHVIMASLDAKAHDIIKLGYLVQVQTYSVIYYNTIVVYTMFI